MKKDDKKGITSNKHETDQIRIDNCDQYTSWSGDILNKIKGD